MIAILAAIGFGAPGPEPRIACHDATVRAEIRYRLADESALRGELAAMLERCRSLAHDVRADSRTQSEAAALFSKHDCAPG